MGKPAYRAMSRAALRTAAHKFTFAKKIDGTDGVISDLCEGAS